MTVKIYFIEDEEITAPKSATLFVKVELNKKAYSSKFQESCETVKWSAAPLYALLLSNKESVTSNMPFE